MVSVIIVTYEQPVTLKALLRCLVEQTYSGGFEVLVCDDGSGSDVGGMVGDEARRLTYEVRYLWQPHRGFRAGAARNQGIRNARGDILVFLDGDMLVAPTFLATHVILHDGEPSIVCGTRQTCFMDRERQLTLDTVRSPDVTLDSSETVRQRSWCAHGIPWMALLSCNFSVRRGPQIWFDEGFRGWGSEDREFAFRLVRRHSYAIRLTMDAEGIHVCWRDGNQMNSPFVTYNHDALVDFIANKIHLVDLYPGDGELQPALGLLTRCYLDSATDRWRIAPAPGSGDVWDILKTAREWFRRNPGFHRGTGDHGVA